MKLKFERKNVVKAQSAIEYLFTYGWMLVAVSIAGGAAYQTISPSCPVQVTGAETGQLQIEDEGLTTGNVVSVVLRNDVTTDITITEVALNDSSEISRSVGINVGPGEAEAVDVAEIDPDSEDCTTADFRITYDYGPLNDQHLSGSLTAPTSFIEAIEGTLETRGGDIAELDMEASVTPRNQSICIGGNCEEEIADELLSGHERYVNRSGDAMRGPLSARDMNFECIGGQCPESGERELQGYVSHQNYTMDGSLELKTINPLEPGLCLGQGC